MVEWSNTIDLKSIPERGPGSNPGDSGFLSSEVYCGETMFFYLFSLHSWPVSVAIKNLSKAAVESVRYVPGMAGPPPTPQLRP